MIPYDESITPPAPVLTIDISPVDEPDRRLTVRALIDTGADISVLPTSLIASLALPPIGETLVSGFEDRPIAVLVYIAAIHIAGARLYPARMVAHDADYALLGRNVLNSLYLRLDGPDLRFAVEARRG